MSPTLAEAPFWNRILEIVPFTGAGSSTVTLSVSSITMMSSCLTESPTLFSQSPISTSDTDSPTEGTFNSTGTLASPSDHGCSETCELQPARRKGSGEELLLLQPMGARRTRCRARRLIARRAGQWVPAKQTLAKTQPQERPSAHVL